MPPEGDRPQTADDVKALVEERGIRFIRLWFTDILGQLKAFSINATELADGEYPAIDGADVLKQADAAKMPDGIQWAYPWGVTLYGALRSTDATGDQDVAEHPRDVALLAVGAPRKQGVSVRVGHRDHVRLLDRVEAGDRRAVEAHAVGEGALELLAAHGEALQLSVDVREPEADELDPVLVDAGDDVLVVGAGRAGSRGHLWSVSLSASVVRTSRMGGQIAS